MFNNSKYTKWYFSIIEKYTTKKSFDSERHHIIPKSLGGTNAAVNLVYIPCKAHFILHYLLPKMLDDHNQRRKMQYAKWRMMNLQSKRHNRTYVVSAKVYATQKMLIKTIMSANNPMHRPEIAIQFRHKRPEQSIVATNRNIKYWSNPQNKIKLSNQLQQRKIEKGIQYIAYNANKEYSFYTLREVSNFIKHPLSTVYKYIQLEKRFDDGWLIKNANCFGDKEQLANPQFMHYAARAKS